MADVLLSNAPALSSTSDMPRAEPPPTPAPGESSIQPGVEAPVAPAPAAEVAAPRPPIRERISELVRQRNAAEDGMRRLETLVSQQGEQLKQVLDAFARTSAPSVPAPGGASSEFPDPQPNRDAFADPGEYDAALVTWASRKTAAEVRAEMRREREGEEQRRREAGEREARERTAREAEERERERATQLHTTWEERRQAALQRYPDFDELTQSVDIPIGSPMAYAILTRDDGPELAYYLGQHPAEATRIARMIVPGSVHPPGTPMAGLPVWDGVAQVFELGKIAAKLGTGAGTAPPAASPTNALAAGNGSDSAPPLAANAASGAVRPTVVIAAPPPPPTPIGMAGAAATQSGGEPTMEEWAVKRNREFQAQRKPGNAMQ